MAKKLTLTELNKLGEKFNERKKIYILDGQYEVDIDVTFKLSDIDDLVMVYASAIQELKEMNDTDEIQIKDTLSLLPTLILRAFTNLPIPKESTDISSLIVISKNLYNLGITEEVYSKLPEEQIKKVTDKINAFGKNIGTVMGEWAIAEELNKTEQGATESKSEMG
ncbi:hypothetical protein [Paenibacillus sp. FSL H3-0333]|uniref:hypothetical protein n=1 Tax=Paenibacillus sp. FSL H3-0333 TaxID=2921373 RepID=UPI0030F4B950